MVFGPRYSRSLKAPGASERGGGRIESGGGKIYKSTGEGGLFVRQLARLLAWFEQWRTTRLNRRLAAWR